MVPLIKKEITGQIAGNVGAYGNVGGVVYLTIYNFSDTHMLFQVMGLSGLICASLCGFFLKEPQNSFGDSRANQLVIEAPQIIAEKTLNRKH
jgi:MFS transporter, NNP family, nitrate/nitrite transporter